MKTHSVKFNFIMNALLTGSSVLFPLITFPYISRVLLVEGSGKVASAAAIITYFTMFATLGMPTYGVRACAQVRDDKEKLSTTAQELLIISSIMTGITYLIFFLCLFLVPEFAEQKGLLIASSISILLNTMGVQWLFSALERYTYITLCALAFKLLGLVMMFAMVHSPEDYIIYGAVSALASYGSGILNFINLRRVISFKKTEPYNFRRHLKPLLIFFSVSAATSIYLNLDIVMLKFMKGDTEVGFYNASVRIKTVLVSLVTSLGTVLMPRMSYYIKVGEHEAFRQMIVKACKFVVVAAGSVMIYFTIMARESILLLSGEAFLDAVLPMQILMPTVLFIGLSNITGIQVLSPLGKENIVLWSIICGAVLDLGLNLVLIPRYGAAGAAFSTMLAEVVVLIFQCCCLRKRLQGLLREIQPQKTALALLCAGGAIGYYKTLVDLSAFWMLFTSVMLFFAIYGIVLLVVRESFTCEIVMRGIDFLRHKKK